MVLGADLYALAKHMYQKLICCRPKLVNVSFLLENQRTKLKLMRRELWCMSQHGPHLNELTSITTHTGYSNKLVLVLGLNKYVEQLGIPKDRSKAGGRMQVRGTLFGTQNIPPGPDCSPLWNWVQVSQTCNPHFSLHPAAHLRDTQISHQ